MKAHDMEDLPPDMLALLAVSDAHRVIYPTPKHPGTDWADEYMARFRAKEDA